MIERADKESKIRVGVTHGDFNGIGYEVILKTFHDQRMIENIVPVIFGSAKILAYYRKSLNLLDMNFFPVKRADQAFAKRLNVINCSEEEVKIEAGHLSPVAGEMAVLALERATEAIRNHEIDVLITAPVNKQNIQLPDFRFPGHTEYLAGKARTENYLMMMVSENIRIGILTGHIPLRDVPGLITRERILQKIKVMNKSLQVDFGISKPRIAVLGLNPHAGDNGQIGLDEKNVIIPALEEAFNNNILAFGPFPPDGFFGSSNFMNYDGILAMYHDQGMLPFKILAFETGINYTAGLPFIRTSPAHGTAFDIAGKNVASPDSFRHAVYRAIDIFRNRKQFDEAVKNSLPVGRPVEEDENAPDDFPPELLSNEPGI